MTIGRDNLALVDCHDDIGLVPVQMIGRPLDPSLEDRFQCVANVVSENRTKGGIHYMGEVRLIAFDGLLPLRSFEAIGVLIGSLDGLDEFVADMAHPQSQSMIAHEPIIRIEID